MNKEAIETRLAQLRQHLVEVQANFSATQGAIQDCEFWLAQLDAEAAQAASPPTPEQETE